MRAKKITRISANVCDVKEHGYARIHTNDLGVRGMKPQKANTRIGLRGKLKNTDMHRYARMIWV